MHDHPLEVPPGEPLRLGQRAGQAGVQAAVVELEEEQVQLGDDEVLVVAGVTDQRGAVVAPGQVVDALGVAHDPQVLAVRLVQLRVGGGAASVDRGQVEDGTVEVGQPFGVHLLRRHRGAVQRHVVVDELAEERVAGRDVRVVQGGAGGLAHLRGQLAQQPIRRAEAVEVLEHHPEPGLFVLSGGQHDVAAARVTDRVLPRLVRQRRGGAAALVCAGRGVAGREEGAASRPPRRGRRHRRTHRGGSAAPCGRRGSLPDGHERLLAPLRPLWGRWGCRCSCDGSDSSGESRSGIYHGDSIGATRDSHDEVNP